VGGGDFLAEDELTSALISEAVLRLRGSELYAPTSVLLLIDVLMDFSREQLFGILYAHRL